MLLINDCPYSKLEEGGRMCESQVEIEMPGPDPGGQGGHKMARGPGPRDATISRRVCHRICVQQVSEQYMCQQERIRIFTLL